MASRVEVVGNTGLCLLVEDRKGDSVSWWRTGKETASPGGLGKLCCCTCTARPGRQGFCSCSGDGRQQHSELCLCFPSGVHLEYRNRPAEADGEVRLVGGSSGCSGGLELKRRGEWRPVEEEFWNLKLLTAFCERLDCGSAVSINTTSESSRRSVWRVKYECLQSLSDLKNCFRPSDSSYSINLRCSGKTSEVSLTACSPHGEFRQKVSNMTSGWISQSRFKTQEDQIQD
uniref:SRCR domain-containing protein n=1 Tax=Salarias fasciatus TaxID=181472 RepID=A0A672JQ26_SALFA